MLFAPPFPAMHQLLPPPLSNFIFPPPPSIYLTAMSILNLAFIAVGFKEANGSNLNYSKFTTHNHKPKASVVKISSKTGALIAYLPATVAAAASYAFLIPSPGHRSFLLTSALFIHFLKRILEVLFVHRFSGTTTLDTSITVSASYFLAVLNSVYSRRLALGHPDPQLDLMIPGIILFFVGILGNFYHHYLLSELRRKSKSSGGNGGDDQYKVPKGGLFNLVVCPHYLFEIVDLFGIAFISQTFYSFCFAIGSTSYLTGRSFATRKWYQAKFEDFPATVRALVPFVF